MLIPIPAGYRQERCENAIDRHPDSGKLYRQRKVPRSRDVRDRTEAGAEHDANPARPRNARKVPGASRDSEDSDLSS